MMEKRPLVWLSAANSNTSLQKALETGWILTRLSLEDPVPIFMSVPVEAKVGVMDLSCLPDGGLHRLEQWLGSLNLTYWIGVVPHRPVTGTRIAHLIARYCSDFHTLPVDYERINTVLGHLWGMATIREPAHGRSRDDYQSLVLEGDSQAICDVRSLLRRFAATREPVLITGESGTGKEAAARFIHMHSARAAGPLITINCAALPDTLTQTELFGYEKGAFTHALNAHPGRLEQANGGSLVLSGIDELNLEQQSAILRFLQEAQIERIGGSDPIPVDCRIITTTSQPLQDLIASGQFRGDVYYRLGGLEVKLPALKSRVEDIPALAYSLLEASQSGPERKRLSTEAVRSLVNHSWPGNFRELQNRLRQALLLSDQPVIEASDLSLAEDSPEANSPSTLSLEEFRARADRQALSCSLKLAHHNVSKAARILKISRVSFYRLLDKYNTAPQASHSRHGSYRKGGQP
ncbi:sigma-54-dependent Fis family transcriptional regulator [Marinobacter sediminum]|uniref:sigma-54 dependent transcriptional regulator n=1 Tax=Marinobacter sediminum TaxID=256323 RepID=UPI00202FB22B|nr:sigma-54 dependent transcriptional regulator [Marinobacter sediminum]MCM0613411.1 sigma-54-dependent Fis family transcriptional regulator [Marinobacter sediminum]